MKNTTPKPKPEMLPCNKCGRLRKSLVNDGTEEFPNMICGTCLSRKERAINTKEMYGKGRRGY